MKRFERSNVLDTALYKTIPLPFTFSAADRSKRFKMTPLQTCSFDTNSASLGSNKPCCNYYAKTIHLHTLYVARYSFIQLSELRLRGDKKNAQT